MNEKDYNLRSAEHSVAEKESHLRQSRVDLDAGTKRLRYEVESTLAAHKKAVAEELRETTRLKEEISRGEIELQRRKDWVSRCQEAIEKPFEAE